MGNIIIEKGFNDEKNHVLELRLVRKDDELILRMRDDCALNDPMRHISDSDDPASGMGIKMILDLATEVAYTSSLKLNNLMIRVGLSGPDQKENMIGEQAHE